MLPIRQPNDFERTTMQYLLLCCFDEARWEKLPEAERDRVMREYADFQQSLARSGHYRAGAKLASTKAATTLRDQAGRRVVTDGPFAETKEQLGGYHLVECRDLDEALAIAQRIPTLRVGGVVEVRPLEFTV
jgi:hypothetical protein